MSRKITISKVKSHALKHNCICLSKKYINAVNKLKFQCDQHHIFYMTWGNFNAGWRCRICAGIKQRNAITLKIDYVKTETKRLAPNHECISDAYINNTSYLTFKCPHGYLFEMTWISFRQGRICPKNRGRRENNTGTKSLLVCPKGHVLLPCNSQQPQRCPVSVGNGNRRKTIKEIKEYALEQGYECISESYVGARSKLAFQCSKEHIFLMPWASFYSGQRCHICYYLSRFGATNPSWKGGISTYPYCLIWKDKEYKESIRERDNHQCQNPDCWDRSKRLCVHHIDYDKKNCEVSNLITLCCSCNLRANVNRDRWQELYSQINTNNVQREEPRWQLQNTHLSQVI